MISIKKKFFRVLGLALALITAFSVTCSAYEENILQNTQTQFKLLSPTGKTVEFNINPEISASIEPDMLNDLLKSHPDAAAITISNIKTTSSYNGDTFLYSKSYTDATKTDLLQPTVIFPTSWTLVETLYSYTQKGIFAKDVFIISVAKGHSIQLGYDFSASLELSVSGDLFKSLAGGLKASITCSHSRTDTFVGPPEGSFANCREYRVKFYKNKGSYVQRVYKMPGKILKAGPFRGTFEEPEKFLEYSVDRKI